MTIFSITPDNNITAHLTAAEANIIPGGEQFSSAKELAKTVANWPVSRLLEIWNSLPGQKPVKKFTDRQAAVGRIWTAIQNLAPEAAAQAAPVAPTRTEPGKRTGQSAKPATAREGGKTAKVVQMLKGSDGPPATAREGSKTAQVVEMLKRPDGATLNDLMTATHWQAHSVRGFVAGTLSKKMGLTITSMKRDDGQRVYVIH